jgi:ribonucleoside-diphosphate reductase alpha chain
VEVAAAPVAQAAPVAKPVEIKIEAAAPQSVGSSTELLEKISGIKSDAPLCMTCGVKMRASGACYVCEGCGSTSGCS